MTRKIEIVVATTVLSGCILFVLSGCNDNIRGDRKHEKRYFEIMQKSAHCFLEFSLNSDSIYLDSALLYNNQAAKLKIKKYNVAILYNKAYIYFLKSDYKNAITTLDSIDTLQMNSVYKTVLIEKTKAKDAETRGDTLLQKKHFDNIIKKYDGFIEKNKTMFDSIMRLPDPKRILEIPNYGAYFFERSYYNAKSKGLNAALFELDSIQKAAEYNLDHIESLKKSIVDLMDGTVSGIVPFE